MSEFRWHPFLGQWVITATHRQDRTFHPPDDYCPLCPTQAGGFATEIPFADYDIVVFENKFPSMSTPPPSATVDGLKVARVAPSLGICEVVCYSSDHNGSMATLPKSQAQKLMRVWQHRYLELSKVEGMEYVFIFENKGREIGVTLNHPHGQIYAFPHIPPIPKQELENEASYFDQTGRSLIEDWVSEELTVGDRVVARNDSFAAIVPYFARYPYEVHIVNLIGNSSLKQMSPKSLDELASILQLIARKYDLLFGFALPYIMSVHQRPVGGSFDFTRFHIEFYPPHRTANKLKFLAGSESGAGAFINDTLPEETARILRSL